MELEMAKTKDLPDEVKKFDASSVSYASRLKLIRKVLVNMKAQSGSVSAAGILFAGDPGVGKTSFIRFVCKLFGLNLVILEVPHVTEEHIINIPSISSIIKSLTVPSSRMKHGSI
jgi:Holliday junction resolvasome RuvABC ATP-dependent DNA helicase subunit